MVFQKREGYLNSCFLQVPNLDLIPEYQTTKSAFTRVTCSGVTLLARETSTWSRTSVSDGLELRGLFEFFQIFSNLKKIQRNIPNFC